MQWDAPSFPAVLGILHGFLPKADVRIDSVPGDSVELAVCPMQHVHVTVGVFSPYAYVLLGIAKAYAVSLYLHTPGMDLPRALELTWDAICPALGLTASPLRDAFFEGPSPLDEQLH